MKEVFQKTNNVKEAITLKKWETHFTRKHFGSLPIYFMFLFIIPKLMAFRLVKIERDSYKKKGLLRRNLI